MQKGFSFAAYKRFSVEDKPLKLMERVNSTSETLLVDHWGVVLLLRQFLV